MIALSVRRGLVPPFLLLAFGAAVALFWPGVQSVWSAWLTPEYSHGPLIPIISAWLFLREMQTKPVLPDRGGRTLGLAVLGLALTLGWVGYAAQIGDVSAYGLILWVFAIVLLAMGDRQGLLHWASVAHLVFMLPLPQVLWWEVNLLLQGWSAELGVGIISALGIPVFLEGHVIDLGVWRLEVAEACSGLRYMFPILSFSVLMAVLFNGPVWTKALLVLSAAPIAILLNAVRIGIIGVLVNSHGIEMAEGILHLMQGWVIFGGCLVLLWLLARLLWGRRAGPMLDLQGVDWGRAWSAALAARPRDVSHVAVVATALLALVMTTWAGSGRYLPDRQPLGLLPASLPWPVASTSLDPQVEAVLAADDYLDAAIVQAAGRAPVNLFIAWYADQTSGSGLHAPEICLPAGGWEIAALATRTIAPAGQPEGFSVNRAIITREGERRLVYYWFDQRGTPMTSAIWAKLDVLVDSLLQGRSDGALIRVMTPIAPGESEEDAEARLIEVLSEVLPALPQFVPG